MRSLPIRLHFLPFPLQVFSAFTEGFTTYTALLSRIQVSMYIFYCPCAGYVHHAAVLFPHFMVVH